MSDSEPRSRHIVYNRAGYRLDVRVDCGAGGSIRLAGQILEREGLPLPEIPVFLVTGDRLLHTSITGRFGEFRMECPAQDRLRLCLSFHDSELIEVDLFRNEPATDDSRNTRLLELLLGSPLADREEVRLDPGPTPTAPHKPLA